MPKIFKMTERDISLKDLRPDISRAKVMSNTGEEERFQNQTLRPIAKFQNDLLISMFKTYITKRKNTYYKLSLPEKQDYIDHAVKRDLKFRNLIKGIFLGLFTDDEYEEYIENATNLDKRIANLCVERLSSNIQYFDKLEN